MTRTYRDYQNAEASEKVGLVIIEPARRLMGWALDSGSVYKLTSFVESYVKMIEDSGVAMTSVTSRASVVAGSYFWDRTNSTLYLQTSDSVNPNGKFIAMTFQLFFSNIPIIAPYDLNSGWDVPWLPYLKSTSQFGFQLDQQQQVGTALEGTGDVVLVNDLSFWQSRYAKYYWENKFVYVYSWNRQLDITEAKLVFKGQVERKQYAPDIITFSLRDTLKEFRNTYPLSLLSSVSGAIIPSDLESAFQRRLFGYVNGHRPTNIDQLIDGGRTMPGTATANYNSTEIVMSGMVFPLNTQYYMTKDDQVSFDGGLTKYTIALVAVDGATFYLTENYAQVNQSGLTVILYPSKPRFWMNRTHLLAGHPIKSPSATVTSVVTPVRYKLSSAECIFAGDQVLINGTELGTVSSVNGFYVTLKQIPQTVVIVGMTIERLAVQNVYIDSNRLMYGRDYIFSCNSSGVAKIILQPQAEIYIAPVKVMTGTITMFNDSTTITGSGTRFTQEIEVGDYIGVQGFDLGFYCEVVEIDSDTSLVVRSNPGKAGVGNARKITPSVYDEGNNVLTCDVLGATSDGTTAGALLATGPDIVRQVVSDIGLSAYVNASAFSEAALECPYRIGLAIPQNFDDQSPPVSRDLINQINVSCFGALVQNADFQFEYRILNPSRSSNDSTFLEKDILTWAFDSLSKDVSSQVQLTYAPLEYDRTVQSNNKSSVFANSDVANYLAKTDNVVTKDTLLIDEQAAQWQANRWSFLLEMASTVLTIDTKLQASRMAIGDKIQISHEKLFQRIGGTDTRKMVSVQAASKDVGSVNIQLDDLCDALSRCAVIAPIGAADFVSSSPSDRSFNGYYTDSYGLIGNDAETFGVNSIW